MHISYEKFVDAFGGDSTHPKDTDPAILEKARDTYNAIALLCGGEPVSIGGANHFGGMSLSGVFDDDNPSFSKVEKAHIRELIAPLEKLDKKAASAPATTAAANKDGDK